MRKNGKNGFGCSAIPQEHDNILHTRATSRGFRQGRHSKKFLGGDRGCPA